MAWELLRTDYVDATFEGLRRYLMSENGDGSVSFHDITKYTVKEGSFFGAKDANKINTAVNAILAALENGTDLYEVFTQFFDLQKTLFLEESDAKQEGFEEYITQLRSYMDSKWDELKTEYTGDIQYFKDVQENAFNVWFQMVRDQLTNDVAGHLQTQIGNLDELNTEDKESLVNAANDLQAQIKNLDDRNTTAHNDLTSAINEAKAASGVTGVKGNKESSYRKGNVNITPANIGALPDDTVPVSKGGTGATTAAAAINILANSAAEGASTPVDNDWYLCQYAGGGTANTSVVRRKMSALWNWIKPKVDSLLTAKVSKSGDTMTGTLNSSKTTGSYLAGNQGQAIINSTATGAYTMLDKLNSTNGYFTDGVHSGSRVFQYTPKTTVSAGTNAVAKTAILLNEDGNTIFPGNVNVAGNLTAANFGSFPKILGRAYSDVLNTGKLISVEFDHSTKASEILVAFACATPSTSKQTVRYQAKMYRRDNIFAEGGVLVDEGEGEIYLSVRVTTKDEIVVLAYDNMIKVSLVVLSL